MAAIPASVDDVTPAWLETVLTVGVPHGLQTTRIGAEHGWASEVWRVELSGCDVPAVTVKLWATDTPASDREVFFYTTLADPGVAWLPRCHHGASDPATHRAALVFEALDVAEQGDALRYADAAMALSIAEAIAELHAPWWDAPRLVVLPWLVDRTRSGRSPQWFERRTVEFVERFGGLDDPLAAEVFDHLAEADELGRRRLRDATPTLLHGDLHLDNVVRTRDDRVVLLDWARCGVGPAAVDLVDLLFLVARPDDVGDVLSAYVHALQSASVEIDDAALVRQIGGAVLWKFATSTLGVVPWVPEDERQAMMIERSLQQATTMLHVWREFDPELFTGLTSG